MNNLFELKCYLLKMHEQGFIWMHTVNPSTGKLGILPCYDDKGNLTGWEFDKDPWYKNGIDYIGLGMYQDQWNTPLWKQAYKELVEDGRLIENPDHAFHFHYVPIDENELKDAILCNKLCVPFQLRRKYNEYMCSPEWHKKKEHILERDEHKCQFCDSTENLQVHHKTYDNLFHESDDDLITLCGECHLREHLNWSPEDEVIC